MPQQAFIQVSVCVQAPLQKYAAVLREKGTQRRAMQSSDEVHLGRKASLIDGASDSEEEEEAPLQQSQREDDAQQADEVSQLDQRNMSLLVAGNQGCLHGSSTFSIIAQVALCSGDIDTDTVGQCCMNHSVCTAH